MKKYREIQLNSRPDGVPEASNFKLVENIIPDLADGQFLVRNSWMSVDPYMRGRMEEYDDDDSYIGSFQLNQPLTGHAVGTVIESRNDNFPVGTHVNNFMGWREYFLSDGTDIEKLATNEDIPLQAYLSVLGLPGSTAYFGLFYVGNVKPGDTVYVSAASGAVGMVVCQLAKSMGCRVVGSAGSQEKLDWLTNELGIDCAINYKTSNDIQADIMEACPDGIDVYFDNVGGEQLEAVLELMNNFGNIVICGMISNYNTGERQPGPTNLINITVKRITVKGIIVTDFDEFLPQFYRNMSKLIEEGKISWRETVVEGIENAPEAFIGLFRGNNVGKMLVRL